MSDWVADYGSPASDPWAAPPPIAAPYMPPPGSGDVTSARPWAPTTAQQSASAGDSQGSAKATQYEDGQGHTTGGTVSAQGQDVSTKGTYGPASGSASATPSASVSAGSYRDADGKQTYGVQGQGGTVTADGKIDLGNGETVSGKANGPNVAAGATANDSTAQVGAQATAVEGAVTAGKQDPNSATDESARFGVGLGAGAAARVHYGDADGDGHREYGFGFDIGPFSGDVKTEDPLRTAAEMALGPTAVAVAEAATGVGVDASGKPVNVTDQAVDAAKSVGQQVGEYGAAAGDAARDLWNYMAD